jgi:hypothetical protein
MSRDDRPFAGPDPPAAVFFYSRDRGGDHPQQLLAGFAGLMQADAYAGFNRLYEAARKPGPIVEAACWAHARRKFFDLARLNQAPIATEAVVVSVHPRTAVHAAFRNRNGGKLYPLAKAIWLLRLHQIGEESHVRPQR